MSLNSLKIATDGYLKRNTKTVLIIAVAGYLNYGTPNIVSSGGDGFGYVASKYDNKNEERENRIKAEDSEIVAIVELMLKTTVF